MNSRDCDQLIEWGKEKQIKKQFVSCATNLCKNYTIYVCVYVSSPEAHTIN